MNISTKDTRLYNLSFKGYDARPLKGFIMMTNYGGIANEMANIGTKESFDVFINNGLTSISKIKKLPLTDKFNGEWAQDILTFIKNNQVLCSDINLFPSISAFFKVTLNKMQESFQQKTDYNKYKNLLSNIEIATPIDKNKFQISDTSGNKLILDLDELVELYQTTLSNMNNTASSTHIQGGNFYIAKNKFGKEIVLVGEDELHKFNKKEMRELFNNENVEIIPQMDFHLDMFIKPLNNGKVLLTDDRLTLKSLNNYEKKLKKALKNSKFKPYKTHIKNILKELKAVKTHLIKSFKDNPFEKSNLAEKELNFLRFDVIRVPGRSYSVENNRLHYYTNFMNANTFLNKNNELVYITNEPSRYFSSNLEKELCDELKFSPKEEFYKYIEPFVKKEHLYFISGQNKEIPSLLNELNGGIHCLCSEIPKFD